MLSSTEITILVSVISVCVAFYFGLRSQKRTEKADLKKDATEMTTVIVKLEYIGNGINEIKSDMKGIKGDITDLQGRMIRVEQSVKSAHHRLDTLEGKYNEDKD